jgi:cell pole-organizing protein PopZ
MNKPATKEPSMDEILSSIRQIIADDDASTAPAPPPPARPVPAPQAAMPAAAPVPPPIPRAVPSAAVAPKPAEPLTLSAAQIVPAARPVPPAPEPAPPAMDFASMLSEIDEPMVPELPAADEPQLVDPEDIQFEVEAEPEPEPPPPPVMRAPEPPPRPVEAPRQAASVARAAPMPDPTLSDDIADQLLEPTTDAAVQGAMSRLGSLADTGIGGMTLEAMIRQMLKPMLKDWLDENLPSLVERLVEREIARISRGVK